MAAPINLCNEQIEFLYIALDMNGDEISKLLNCSKSSVCRRIKKMGVTKSAYGHDGRNGKKGIVCCNGYPVVYLPNHPRAKSNGYVREHIVVMEKLLGIKLTDEEVVHHINGNKSDNRPENLKLFANNSEHMMFHWKERQEQ